MRQPPPSGAPLRFDRIADQYDATRGGERRGQEFADGIEPLLVPGRVLEVGVGTGVVAAALAQRGRQVAGLDLSAPMLALARQRLGGRVGLGDARALPVGDAAVDNVLFVMVLHVVGDVGAAFAQAARVLRPGGRVVATYGTPIIDPPDDGQPDDITGALSGLDLVRATRSDDPAAVVAAADRAGFTIVHTGATEPVRLSHSPAETAADIEARLWSYLWRVPDEDWPRLVGPTLEALRALPDQDRPRHYAQRHRLVAFSRAA